MHSRHTTARRSSRWRRFTGATTAALATAALAVGILSVAPDTTPSASAAPGNLVVFGDSYAANPDFRMTYDLVDTTGYPRTGGCVQAPDNWPRKVAEKAGRTLHDWSCNGNTSGDVVKRIEDARRAGQLNEKTGTVAISVGMNNYGPGAFQHDGRNFLDPAEVRRTYIEDLKTAADKIHRYAPNANIIMPGMLSIASGDMVCPVNVVPGFPVGLPVPLLGQVETWLMETQQAAAKAIGARFIDIKTPSAGHATCATPDGERYVTGVVDTTSPTYYFFFHPSERGSEFVANKVNAAL